MTRKQRWKAPKVPPLKEYEESLKAAGIGCYRAKVDGEAVLLVPIGTKHDIEVSRCCNNLTEKAGFFLWELSPMVIRGRVQASPEEAPAAFRKLRAIAKQQP